MFSISTPIERTTRTTRVRVVNDYPLLRDQCSSTAEVCQRKREESVPETIISVELRQFLINRDTSGLIGQ